MIIFQMLSNICEMGSKGTGENNSFIFCNAPGYHKTDPFVNHDHSDW